MKHLLPLLSLVAILAAATPVRADPVATAANQLLITQLLDAGTTRVFERMPGTFERDPFMRPFVKSDVVAVAAAIVSNLLMRRFLRAPQLRATTLIEGVAVMNNVRIIAR